MDTRLRFARIPAIAVVLVLAACSGSGTGNAGDTTDALDAPDLAPDLAPADIAGPDAAEDPSTAETLGDVDGVAMDVVEDVAPVVVATDTPPADVYRMVAERRGPKK